MIQAVSEFLAEQLSPTIISIFGQGSFFAELFVSNPLLVPIVFIILPAIIFFCVALFVDFIKDSWKMPIGIVLDLLAVVFFVINPNLLIIFAVVSAVVFFILARGQNVLRWIYAVIGFIKFILLVPFLPLPELVKTIIVFIPILTITMFFLCITD
ncbi:MAG: hypothetical protein KKF46_06810 [Nanoarchaeota archaeon]|nr:hypothetical protein [Nanoarchaeota archaeon]MBU1322040.1 hypothetical protein [Nanoarchaeota archaeon]MBU1597232.1 hypothetical protein [Nanoarchaeota archaeon]MBU2440723.1 hypothetical protein [Nanoarchaeota archaeon]